MVRKTRAEAQATREGILDAAELAFLERGVSRCSLEAIAARAGVTRGAIYWHFRNKADLFDALLERVRQPLDDLRQALADPDGGASLQTLRRLVRGSLERLTSDEHHQRVYTILFHRCERVPEVAALLEREEAIVIEAREAMRTFFTRLRARGELHPAVEVDDAVEWLHAFIVGVISSWLRDPGRYDLAARADTLVAMFLAGLSRPSGPTADA